MFEQKKPHMVEYVQYTTHVYIKTLNIIYCLRTTEIDTVHYLSLTVGRWIGVGGKWEERRSL